MAKTDTDASAPSASISSSSSTSSAVTSSREASSSISSPTTTTEPHASPSIVTDADSCWQQSPKKKKIPFNPSAGQVHARERGQPWRIEYETQIIQQNDKARQELAEKRRWGLAKQIHEGLVLNYKVNYGVAEFTSLLRDALLLQARKKTDSKSEAAARNARDIALLQLLAAAEKYDLKQILALLDKFPKGPAGGGGGSSGGASVASGAQG